MNSRFCFALLCIPAFGLVAGAPACSSSNTSGGTVVPGDGGPGTADGATSDGPASDAPPGGTQCSKARDDLLLPINKTSTGAVSIVSESGATKTIYVDASAGGFTEAVKNPRIYIDLATGEKVDVTDKTALESTAWDLALKRQFIFTNSGDAGIGVGGAIQLNTPFSAVTEAEANAAMIERERFFNEECVAEKDQFGFSPNSTFSDWYNYDSPTMMITTPKDVTYIVSGGTGKKYKLGIKTYRGLTDGGTGTASGIFVLQVTAL